MAEVGEVAQRGGQLRGGNPKLKLAWPSCDRGASGSPPETLERQDVAAVVADHVEDAVGRGPEALRRGRQRQVDAAGDLALGGGDVGGVAVPSCGDP